MTSANLRTASCACGDLKISASGDPERISSCSCIDCQRRTGSVFGVTAFFQEDQINLMSGDPKTFTRTADSGNVLDMNFCPTCGTTLFWTLAEHPGRVVIAVGCFADPRFPAPERHVWAKHKHYWMEFPAQVNLYDEGP